MAAVPNRRVIVHLYRSFMRTAKKFDNNAAAKALLYRKHVNSTSKSTAEVYYKEVIDSVLFKGKLFNPINCFMPLSERVNEEFRRKHDVLLTERIDAGFSLLRAFTSVWSTYLECLKDSRQVEDYKPFIHDNSDEKNIYANSSAAVESAESMYDFPVRLTSAIRTGTLLIAHPLVQGHKHRAVILVLESNSNGAYGLIINMPTDKTLAEATRNIPGPILDVFGRIPVQYGGVTRRLQFLHPFDNIGGSRVADGEKWYFGGNVIEAINIVGGNPAAKDAFTFYAGCCFWTTKQLQHEIQQGYWISVIASPTSVLRVAEAWRNFGAKQREHAKAVKNWKETSSGGGTSSYDDSGGSPSEDSSDGERLVGQATSATSAAARHSSSESTATYQSKEQLQAALKSMRPPPELWRTLLRGLGSDFAHISTLPSWLDLSKVEPLDWR